MKDEENGTEGKGDGETSPETTGDGEGKAETETEPETTGDDKE